MNNNEISNPKIEVEETVNMNDCDYLTSVLECEKNMSTNLSIALNEASNEVLYNKLYQIYKEVQDMQRELYEVMFQKGWYKLEKADANKINQKYNELSQKLNQLP